LLRKCTFSVKKANMTIVTFKKKLDIAIFLNIHIEELSQVLYTDSPFNFDI